MLYLYAEQTAGGSYTSDDCAFVIYDNNVEVGELSCSSAFQDADDTVDVTLTLGSSNYKYFSGPTWTIEDYKLGSPLNGIIEDVNAYDGPATGGTFTMDCDLDTMSCPQDQYHNTTACVPCLTGGGRCNVCGVDGDCVACIAGLTLDRGQCVCDTVGEFETDLTSATETCSPCTTETDTDCA